MGLPVGSVLLGAAVRALGRAAPSHAGAELPTPDDAAGTRRPCRTLPTRCRPGATLNVLAIGSANLFRPEASLAPGSLLGQSFQGATPDHRAAGAGHDRCAQRHGLSAADGDGAREGCPGRRRSKVTVRGGRGLSATDQLQLLIRHARPREIPARALADRHRRSGAKLPAERIRTNPGRGRRKVEQAGADLVLIDPQFSRFLQTNSNIDPYEQAFQVVGSMPNVLLFHRFDLMRSWVNDGQIDLERTPKANRLQAVEQLHACLGEQLARLVLSGARPEYFQRATAPSVT